MGWEIPIRKALKGLLWYIAMPMFVLAVLAIVFDDEGMRHPGNWIFIAKVFFSIWFLRQVLRFYLFAWKRNHIRLFNGH